MYTKQGTSRLPCPSIGLFLEPDETGREKPSERFSRQAAAGGCARGRWNAPLARRVRHLSTQHSASPKATPPRLEFLKQEEKVADRPLHPSPRLELFSRFVRCFQRATSHFATRSRASPPHEKIDEEDHQSSTRGLCILCVRRTLCTEGTFLFSLISARMMPLPILVLHITLPKCEHATEKCSKLPLSSVEAVVDALPPSPKKVYKLQLPVIAQGRCGCLSSGP